MAGRCAAVSIGFGFGFGFGFGRSSRSLDSDNFISKLKAYLWAPPTKND